ncbi:NUDIX domain-containing protein [Candidatus Micrarchaeota archaeon]|nr:NUDIX domain-containing protein [Candidatus Micrarchaeota archaeon]
MIPASKKNLKTDLVASVFILNPSKTKTLLLFHRKLKKWLGPGGHLEEGETPAQCVVREAFEEAGVRIKLLDFSPKLDLNSPEEETAVNPYCCLLELIPAHASTPEHLHFDFVFIGECVEGNEKVSEREASDLKWFSLSEVRELDTFPAIIAVADKLMQE